MNKILPLFLILSLSCIHANAQSLDGDQLAAFDPVCPGDPNNTRAVWAEPLQGALEGWVNLVCLDETLQETMQWFVSPDGLLFESIEEQIPVFVRPFVTPVLSDRINAMNDDETIALWLDFSIVEPVLPSLEFYGALPGVSSSGSVATSGDAPVVSTFYIDGREVTEAEFEVWQQAYITALRAQNAERDQLVREQAVASLQLLADTNNWHDWLDISIINDRGSELPVWYSASLLVLELDGIQARELLGTGESLVFIEEYPEESTDGDGFTPSTGGSAIETTSITTSSDQIIVNGNEISWPDDGWYQVQLIGDDGNANLCEGGRSCEVPQGEYIVINLTTGERFTGIQVSGSRDPVEITNPFSAIISPVTNLRLIVYSDTSAELFWEREDNPARITSTNIIRNGVELASTNGTSYFDDTRVPGELFRYEIVVRGPADGESETVSIADEGFGELPAMSSSDVVVVDGNTIILPDDGYYQIQNALSHESICEGVSLCDVPSGTYIVINHTSGERFEDVQVANASSGVTGASSSSITVLGNTISWPDDGWYQVQNADTFESVCEGGLECNVSAGSYVVINHSSGERFEDVRVEF